MKRKPIPLGPQAALVKGALLTFLAPHMAQDARLNLNSLLSGVTAKNFPERKDAILGRLTTSLNGKLAMDSKFDSGELSELFESLSDIREVERAYDEESAEKNAEGEEDYEALDKTKGKDKKAKDKKAKDQRAQDEENKFEEMKERMKDKGASDEDLEAMDALFHAKDAEEEKEEKEGEEGDKKAKDAEEEDDKEKMEGKDKKARDKKAKDQTIADPVSKGAMDAAIKRAEDRAIARVNAIYDAKEAVRPWTGALSMAFDSADEVYAHALETMGEDIEGIHASAFPALLKRIPVPGSETKQTRRIAMDAKHVDILTKHCPDALRVGLA